MAEFRLIEEITARSDASDWETAKREWKLRDVYRSDTPQICLCGHFPIKEICVIENTENGEAVEVGNCCVKKFLGLPSDLILKGLTRIQEDIMKALNEEAIEHAFKKGWINTWEREFSLDTRKKRNLSSKQMDKRVHINSKVNDRIDRKGI